jgi:peptidyl-prolyl cis-trans isomerase SurA
MRQPSYSRIFLFSLFALSAFPGFGQEKHDEKVIVTVGKDEVRVDEFWYAFEKNNQASAPYAKEEIDDYLQLYINFKLKVVEAKHLGYDTMAIFKEEFAEYRSQLENSYMVSDTETERLVLEAHGRLRQEVKASHILLMLDADALPKDTLIVYQKLIDIRNEIIAGADFGAMAVQYSEDPSAKSNKGQLGYFSAMQMVYAFETAAFTTSVGEISMPVRTQFGYHIIRVDDVRASEGKVKVAHIMLQPPSAQSQEKIMQLYEQLNAGADWAQLCAENSADRRTSQTGGELAPFSKGQIVAEFSEAAFALTEPGEISDPFQTQFGWHIVKLIEKIPPAPFEEMEEELTQQVKRDARYEVNKIVLINNLKQTHHLVENATSLDKVLEAPKSMFIKSRWRFDSTWRNNPAILFRIEAQSYTIGDFLVDISTVQPQDSTSGFLYKQYTSYRDKSLIDYEKNHLGEKYPEFKYLVKEYYEGILLFSIMEDEVWNKAVEDTTGLKSYYEDHIEAYRQVSEVQAIMVKSDSLQVIEQVQAEFERIKPQELLSEDEKQRIESKFNDSSTLSLQIVQGNFKTADEPVFKSFLQPGDTVQQDEAKWYYLNVLNIIKSDIPPLDKVRGSVLADYQTYLEKNWIEQLRGAFPVNINEKTLSYVYKRARKK